MILARHSIVLLAIAFIAGPAHAECVLPHDVEKLKSFDMEEPVAPPCFYELPYIGSSCEQSDIERLFVKINEFGHYLESYRGQVIFEDTPDHTVAMVDGFLNCKSESLRRKLGG